jgi:hypothetical protein
MNCHQRHGGDDLTGGVSVMVWRLLDYRQTTPGLRCDHPLVTVGNRVMTDRTVQSCMSTGVMAPQVPNGPWHQRRRKGEPKVDMRSVNAPAAGRTAPKMWCWSWFQQNVRTTFGPEKLTIGRATPRRDGRAWVGAGHGRAESSGAGRPSPAGVGGMSSGDRLVAPLALTVPLARVTGFAFQADPGICCGPDGLAQLIIDPASAVPVRRLGGVEKADGRLVHAPSG